MTSNYVIKGEKRFVDTVVKVVRGLQVDIKTLSKQQEMSSIKIHELQLFIAKLHEELQSKKKRSHDDISDVESGHLSPECTTPVKKRTKVQMQLVSKSKNEKTSSTKKLSSFKSCELLYLSIKSFACP